MTDELAVASATNFVAHGQHFLDVVNQVAENENQESNLVLLLLALADLLAAGSRLGAVSDVLPELRFEPDDGREPELEELREKLTQALKGLDEYVEVIDPIVEPELEAGQITADLVAIASQIIYGMNHYLAGQITEAAWWWQYSYFSDWADRAVVALRVVQRLLIHARLDIPADVVQDAQFEALHSGILNLD